MGVVIFRREYKNFTPGVQVFQPRAAVASGGWWDNNGAISGCVAAYAAKGAASLAASYTNLTGNATFDAVPSASPAWDTTNGWQLATNKALDTGVVPTSSYSIIVRVANWTRTPTNCLFGTYVSSAANAYYVQSSTSTNSNYSNGAVLSVTSSITSGVIAVAGKAVYHNGSNVGTIGAGANTPVYSIYIGALHTGGGALSQYTTANVLALAIYSTTLSAGNVATITTAMQAL